MLLSVSHTTRYDYSDEATYSIQSLRFTPPNFDGQQVKNWDVSVAGALLTDTGADAFGNILHLAILKDRHSQVVITATGEVEVEDRNGIVSGLSEQIPLRVYLRQTFQTAPDGAIKDLAEATPGKTDLERLHALMQAVREAVAYTVGTTDAHTTAAQALSDGKGVCQDHAHIFIACARHLQIPARYVAGYMSIDECKPADAHHAWAEAFTDGLGWVGFDVSNGICPNDHYIRLSMGLDSHYAAPVRGSRIGGSSEKLGVSVSVQQQ